MKDVLPPVEYTVTLSPQLPPSSVDELANELNSEPGIQTVEIPDFKRLRVFYLQVSSDHTSFEELWSAKLRFGSGAWAYANNLQPALIPGKYQGRISSVEIIVERYAELQVGMFS